MCYSAQVWANYHKYVKAFGAAISIFEFAKLYGHRQVVPGIKIPKAMDAAFAEPATAEEREIKVLIDQFNVDLAKKLEADLFKQRKRLADAIRILETKPTKKAQDDQRIAGDKIERAKDRLADLHRTDLKDRDSRIFPNVYVPVMVLEDGKRIIKPMRYGCRLAGKPANYDIKYPGTYNARRDNLEHFWKGAFGYTHGIMVVNRFYENVSRHAAEGRDLAPGELEQNVVLEFAPRPAHDMLVACLWSHWIPPAGSDEPELLSFAAITDDPPPEIAAAGHDRCIVPIKLENMEAWLNPDPGNLVTLQAILDDRDRPYYEHRMAA